MYLLSSEGLHVNETYGTAVVLLVLVLGINCLSSFVARKLAKHDTEMPKGNYHDE